MKLKIMQSKDAKVLEVAYNEFESNNNVHFTQSHVNTASFEGSNYSYFSVYIYYTEKKQLTPAPIPPKADFFSADELEKIKTLKLQTPQLKQGEKLCPKCNAAIPEYWNKHFVCGWGEVC